MLETKGLYLDKAKFSDWQGIKAINVVDWLLGKYKWHYYKGIKVRLCTMLL